MPLTQVCAPLINSTTGHYNSTGTHSTSLWLAFLTSVQQGRALECSFISLDNMSINCHGHQPQKYGCLNIPNAQLWSQWCPHQTGSTVAIHLSPCFYVTYITCGSSLIPRLRGRRERSLSSHIACVQGQCGSYCLVPFLFFAFKSLGTRLNINLLHWCLMFVEHNIYKVMFFLPNCLYMKQVYIQKS